MQMMRTKLYEEQVRKQEEEIARHRKALSAPGIAAQRSGPIIFPRAVYTDHRINYTSYNLDAVMNGGYSGFY